MKLTHHLVLLSLGLSIGLANAEDEGDNENVHTGIYVANGLTITETQDAGLQITGWYDAEKTRVEDADDYMCYAASAANLLAWWQNGDRSVESDAPTEVNDIWHTFVENNQLPTTGGTVFSAINWWLSGVYSPATQSNQTDGSPDTWEWSSADNPMWERYYHTHSEMVWDNGSSEVIPVSLPNLSKKGEDYFGGYYYDRYSLTQEQLSDFLISAWF